MGFNINKFKEKMNESLNCYEESLKSIRVGRANASVLNNVQAEYYGTLTPINQMGEIKVTDPRTLTISPWDISTLKSIEKAILASDVGITPQSDGKVIRLSFPQLTEDRRKELTKQISKMGEETKIVIRNIRRDANEEAKKQEKNNELTEDDLNLAEEDIQKLTDASIKKVDSITARKSAEVLEI